MAAANDERSRPLCSHGVMAPVAVDPPAEMTILSIEEWTSHVAIHSWFASPTPSTDIDLRLQAGLLWTIVDDAAAPVGSTHREGSTSRRAHEKTISNSAQDDPAIRRPVDIDVPRVLRESADTAGIRCYEVWCWLHSMPYTAEVGNARMRRLGSCCAPAARATHTEAWFSTSITSSVRRTPAAFSSAARRRTARSAYPLPREAGKIE